MKKYFLAIILLTWLPCAFAKVNPYQVELPAQSQADDIRAQLMKDGLVQVLANLSEDKKIEKMKIANPERFVQEYRYLPSQDASTTKYLLRIRYNKIAVNEILTKSGILKSQPAISASFILQVSPIKRSEELYAMLRQVERVEGVQKAELIALFGETVLLSVSVQDSMEQFHQHTSSHRHLALKSQELAENKLIYEWLS